MISWRSSQEARASPNDSSSETAEGGSGLAQPVPNGGAQNNRPESEGAPDAAAQAVTDRSRPERFSAAPLLAVIVILVAVVAGTHRTLQLTGHGRGWAERCFDVVAGKEAGGAYEPLGRLVSVSSGRFVGLVFVEQSKNILRLVEVCYP